MTKRWIIGGIWAILMAAGVLMGGRNATAEQPRTSEMLVISDVVITGNRRMTTEKIKARLQTQPGKEYNPSVVDDDVRELYKINKFSNIVTYLAEDGPGKVKICFTLCEMPNRVQKVTFLGAKHVKTDELKNITGVREGMPLNPNFNLVGCQKIIAKYEEMGRSFTCCALVKGGDLADTEVVYEINEGPKMEVHDIQFTGNTFVSSARLATYIRSSKQWFHRIGGIFNKEMAEADVNELYKYFRGFGYQDVRIALETQRSADSGEITIIFHIQEGPRYRLKDVPEVHSKGNIPCKQLKTGSSLKPGDYLDEGKIKSDVKSLTDYFGCQGKGVRVEVIPVWLRDVPGLVNIRYEVHETPSRIGKIRVTGSKRISSESILAHVPLVPDQVLSFADLKQAERNLAELGLFVVDAAAGVRPTITVIDVGGDNERKDLLITVKEKRQAKIKSVERP
jgi:outer membrane protein insertion porin family